jgi:cholesterol oxidase
MQSTDGPFNTVIKRMQTPNPGITFNETMKGAFALGLTDPKSINDSSGAGRDTLAIHVTVHIDDVDRFVVDPSHTGRLTGSIEFPEFGGSVPATHGVFNLFSPTNDPALTTMVYELGFRHDGKSYYLAGHKDVRDDSGFDLWSDTTTLYVTLHQGDDSTGGVLGAGVLQLGVVELAALVRSMRATNTNGIADSARVIATFGKFFMRELWSTYGRASSGSQPE